MGLGEKAGLSIGLDVTHRDNSGNIIKGKKKNSTNIIRRLQIVGKILKLLKELEELKDGSE